MYMEVGGVEPYTPEEQAQLVARWEGVPFETALGIVRARRTQQVGGEAMDFMGVTLTAVPDSNIPSNSRDLFEGIDKKIAA